MLDAVANAADRPASKRPVATASLGSQLTEIRDFEVRVDNTTRGTHRLTIKLDGEKEHVGIQTDVKVDVIVYAYVYKFRGTEVWHDGRLLESDVRCEDGGKKRSFSLKTAGEIQQISFNDKSVKGANESLMSTAYWRLPNAELRTKPFAIVDVDTGKTSTSTLTEIGDDSISADGRAVACRRFKIEGVSPAELWFDESDRLVQQKSVERGHSMELLLKQIRTSNAEK